MLVRSPAMITDVHWDSDVSRSSLDEVRCGFDHVDTQVWPGSESASGSKDADRHTEHGQPRNSGGGAPTLLDQSLPEKPSALPYLLKLVPSFSGGNLAASAAATAAVACARMLACTHDYQRMPKKWGASVCSVASADAHVRCCMGGRCSATGCTKLEPRDNCLPPSCKSLQPVATWSQHGRKLVAMQHPVVTGNNDWNRWRFDCNQWQLD